MKQANKNFQNSNPQLISVIIKLYIKKMFRLIKYRFYPLFGSKRKIEFEEVTSKKINKVASQIQRVTEITLGPYGRNIMIQNQMNDQAPRITKDGVTVVKHIQFEDRLEDAICTLIKKSVDYTNKYAGDGTTTSTLLIGQIMARSIKQISIGIEPKKLRKGFEIGRDLCLQFLDASKRKVKSVSKPIKQKQQLYNVAMISTNRKTEIAELISDTVFKADHITIEKSQKTHNFVEFYTGKKFSRGIESEEYVNTQSGNIVYNYPLVVTSKLPVKNIQQIIQCLELAKKARKQLIIFAPEISESVKSTLIYNNKKKIVEVSGITVPPYGDVGQNLIPQIAKLTNSYLFGEIFDNDTKIENIDFEHMGKCRKLVVDKYETKIEGFDKDNKTSNTQATIFVGGPNQTVMLENYDHLVDALNSVKSAKKDGIVAGGGITYWRMADLLINYQGEGKEGVKVLAQALKVPRKKLMQYIPSQNKPLSGENWEGFDLKQWKTVDMFEAGIVDSVNVAKSAIIDSLSICNVLVEVNVGISPINLNLSSISLKDLNAKFRL